VLRGDGHALGTGNLIMQAWGWYKQIERDAPRGRRYSSLTSSRRAFDQIVGRADRFHYRSNWRAGAP